MYTYLAPRLALPGEAKEPVEVGKIDAWTNAGPSCRTSFSILLGGSFQTLKDIRSLQTQASIRDRGGTPLVSSRKYPRFLIRGGCGGEPGVMLRSGRPWLTSLEGQPDRGPQVRLRPGSRRCGHRKEHRSGHTFMNAKRVERGVAEARERGQAPCGLPGRTRR